MSLGGQTSLHVVFRQSAAGSIRQALEIVGRRERVIGCPDTLSFGPINPPNPDLRRDWAVSVLNFEYGSMLDCVPEPQSAGDMVLFGRMIALGEAGLLEVEGDGPHMRNYRVRRAQKPTL